MLVIRKELKMGLGIGAAVLGIAAVYGLMATLSSSGGSSAPNGTETVATSTDTGPHGLDSAVTGLPPKVGDDTSVALTKPLNPSPSPSSLNDPFAESSRTDGNKTDPWTLALATGKVNTDPKPTVTPVADNGPLVVTTPTPPSVDTAKTDTRVDSDPGFVPSGKTSNTTSNTGIKTSAPGSTYVVKPGDTFSTIAAKTLGSKRYYSLIAKANPNVDPRRMRVGTEITIPAKETVANISGAADAERVTLTRPIDTSRQYRVEAGDTLHRIALKLYGKTSMWESLYDRNKQLIGPDAGKLKVGTLLTLPKAATRV